MPLQSPLAANSLLAVCAERMRASSPILSNHGNSKGEVVVVVKRGRCLDAVYPVPDADAGGQVLELRCHHLKLVRHLGVGVQVGGRVRDLELACRRTCTGIQLLGSLIRVQGGMMETG